MGDGPGGTDMARAVGFKLEALRQTRAVPRSPENVRASSWHCKGSASDKALNAMRQWTELYKGRNGII